MIAETPSLFGSINLNEFRKNHYNSKSVYYPMAVDQLISDKLCSVNDLSDILSKMKLQRRSVQIISDGVAGPTKETDTSGASINNEILAGLVQGRSIRLTSIDDYHIPLRNECIAMSKMFGARTNVNSYITPSANKAFKPHFDCHDVWILQVAGSKRWQLYKSYSNFRENPIAGLFEGPENHEPGEVLEEHILSPGDLLYIPRGKMHSAFCEDQHSIHLTFGLEQITYVQWLEALLAFAKVNSSDLREQVNDDIFSFYADQNNMVHKFKKRMDSLFESEEIFKTLELFRQKAAKDTLHFPEPFLQNVLLSKHTDRAEISRIRMSKNAYVSVLKSSQSSQVYTINEEFEISKFDLNMIDYLISNDWIPVETAMEFYENEAELFKSLDVMFEAGLVEYSK